MKRVSCLFGVAVLALAGSAGAQTFGSFIAVDGLHGVTVDELGPLQYQVTVGSNPRLEHNGSFFPIDSVFGFWALSLDDDLTGTVSPFGVWQPNASNSGAGGILGWRTNPNQGLAPGSSEVFTFDPGTVLTNAEYLGFHVRLSWGTFPGTTGNTGYAYVPEPSCYPNCKLHDPPGLDVFDFLCFFNEYDAGSSYACDCDFSSGPGVCDIFDFLCFQKEFAAGCP